MGICEYYLNGHCRFGTRCVNDHIDLKTLLKTEVESAVSGKQWMLSCFGPFKGSVCFPNFIPDRSYEEVRLSFLEAKKNGNIQGHTNELIMQYNDAMAKMNQLKNCSQDTIQLVVNIYNQSIQQDKNKATKVQQSSSAASNVFGGSSSNVFGPTPPKSSFMSASSIFGTQQPTTAAPSSNVLSAGSIFGSSQTSNPFQASSQTSIFGAAKPSQPTIDSSSSTFPFSMPQSFDQQPQQSIFGSSPTTQSNIFGAPATFGQPSGNIFAMNQQQQTPQQQQPAAAYTKFPGTTFNNGSIFGSATNSSIFGGQQQQQMQPQVPQIQPQQQPFAPFGGTGGVFGTSAPSSSIFGQQQQPSNQGSIFGSQQQPDQQTLVSAIPQQTTGIFNQFGQSNHQPVSQPSTNVFSQAQTQSQPSFQNQQSNVFGQTQSQPPPHQQQSAGNSIFQINQSNQPASNLVNPFVTQPQKIDDSVYSDPNTLSQDDIAAFQSDRFEFGKIPLNPPPKQFCF